MPEPLTFEPLYYGDRLRVVNPCGDVGVVTLWSQVDQAVLVFEKGGVDLGTATSRIAVIANLFGNGLPQMLRNMLWNPQIRHLIVLGKDLSGSRQELLNFFDIGLEEVEYLGSRAHRIADTKRIIDPTVQPADFDPKPCIYALGQLGDADTPAKLREVLSALPAPEPASCERRNVPIPQTEVSRYPSNPRNHNVVATGPLEAWQEVVFRLVRFGYLTKLRKGERLELQNVRVVVESPVEDAEEQLAAFGFSLAHFRDYGRRMLDAVRPADLPYTYGNRIRGHFRYGGEPVDSLAIAGERLRNDAESRHAYVATWDNSLDLPTGKRCPCLVSLFFRRFEERLTLTACFRTHNAMDAWLENVYGLMSLQREVANRAGMEPGPVTVISHSISVDAALLDKARMVADEYKRAGAWKELRFDPNGSFAITIDKAAGELIVEHSYQGMAIAQYRGKSAEEIERQLVRDAALSQVSHALYLGRELARKEAQLKAARA